MVSVDFEVFLDRRRAERYVAACQAHAAREIERLGKLIDRLHACQSRALVRHLASWEDVRRLAGLGVDLIAMAEDERDAG